MRIWSGLIVAASAVAALLVAGAPAAEPKGGAERGVQMSALGER